MCSNFVLLLLLVAIVSGAPSMEREIRSNRRSRGLGCNCECGQPNLRHSRVVGGEDAIGHEFPWIASLRRKGDYYCGATLITKKHVLTAAHCINGIDYREVEVVLSDHDRNAVERVIVVRRVVAQKQHADFDKDTYNNDIAIMELDRPVEFSETVKPACIPKAEANYTSRVGVVAGWGLLAEGKDYSKVLQKTKVPVWSRQQCLKDSGYQTKRITENMICAGYRQGKQDACQGDSGGPLQLTNDHGNMEVIGVVSWGRGCGRPNLPGVYTKLTNYLGWVDEALNGECLCSPPSH